MNRDELIEKCLKVTKQRIALASEVNLRPILSLVIPIIEAEARKAEREYIIKEIEKRTYVDAGGYIIVDIGKERKACVEMWSWWQTLKKGEGDE